MRRLTAYRALERSERRVLHRALAGLGLARLLVPALGLPRTRRAVGAMVPVSAVSVQRLARLVTAAANALPGTTCLPRAIVLEAVLRAAGHPAELRIGVAPLADAPRLRAHAWVEVHGAPVGEDPSDYHPLPVFGTHG